MSVVIILILASLSIGLAFLGAFIWSVCSGQYEDTTTPSLRILAEDGGRSVSPVRFESNGRDARATTDRGSATPGALADQSAGEPDESGWKLERCCGSPSRAPIEVGGANPNRTEVSSASASAKPNAASAGRQPAISRQAGTSLRCQGGAKP